MSTPEHRYRMGSVLALLGLLLSAVLAWHLGDHTPFTVVGLAAVGGKWVENTVERHAEGRAARQRE